MLTNRIFRDLGLGICYVPTRKWAIDDPVEKVGAGYKAGLALNLETLQGRIH
jgi:hypothetical protein